ncbi:hypothetical protein M3226_24735 [Neobacillus cucumis]|uniref:hypothetical protein n=1 Tax=Neobacillus cucumis TaxID=1740721 RepID=UPI00203BF113|nr:hypothetical protein [Neobacillus cucumis]MCM3728850.1 hypothetical protein [Neobacillus cucumis]
MQNTFEEGVWMNLGVDRFMQMTPQLYQPGIRESRFVRAYLYETYSTLLQM